MIIPATSEHVSRTTRSMLTGVGGKKVASTTLGIESAATLVNWEEVLSPTLMSLAMALPALPTFP